MEAHFCHIRGGEKHALVNHNYDIKVDFNILIMPFYHIIFI